MIVMNELKVNQNMKLIEKRKEEEEEAELKGEREGNEGE